MTGRVLTGMALDEEGDCRACGHFPFRHGPSGESEDSTLAGADRSSSAASSAPKTSDVGLAEERADLMTGHKCHVLHREPVVAMDEHQLCAKHFSSQHDKPAINSDRSQDKPSADLSPSRPYRPEVDLPPDPVVTSPPSPKENTP